MVLDVVCGDFNLCFVLPYFKWVTKLPEFVLFDMKQVGASESCAALICSNMGVVVAYFGIYFTLFFFF